MCGHEVLALFFFPRCSQLLLHPGARGCDNYQNVYYVSLLIMQKPRQSPVRKRGHHTQGLGSGEGSSLPPEGGLGPALPPHRPRPCLGGLAVGPGCAHPADGAFTFSSPSAGPLRREQSSLPSGVSVSLTPPPQACDLLSQEAFQKIPPATPTVSCS